MKKKFIPVIIMMIVCTQLNMLTASAQPIKFAMKTIKRIGNDLHNTAERKRRDDMYLAPRSVINVINEWQRVADQWTTDWAEIESLYPDADIDVVQMHRDFSGNYTLDSIKSAYSYILREK